MAQRAMYPWPAPSEFTADDLLDLPRDGHRYTAPCEAMWADPANVALVVEVESKGSRRHDRFTKPSLYAEAGIESYWRIERTSAGPVAHLCSRATGGHYQLHRSVNPGDSHRAELPFAVQVAPATWRIS